MISLGEGNGLQVLLTRQFTTVDGVVDDRGATVTGCSVVIFVDDPGRWTPQSRFVDVLEADADGRFRTIALPPGRYIAVAFDGVGAASPRARSPTWEG